MSGPGDLAELTRLRAERDAAWAALRATSTGLTADLSAQRVSQRITGRLRAQVAGIAGEAKAVARASIPVGVAAAGALALWVGRRQPWQWGHTAWRRWRRGGRTPPASD